MSLVEKLFVFPMPILDLTGSFRSISGLVTTWGGANSHMAIRAGELSLPAAIGVGETTFKEVSKGDRVHLDCKGKRIEVLS